METTFNYNMQDLRNSPLFEKDFHIGHIKRGKFARRQKGFVLT